MQKSTVIGLLAGLLLIFGSIMTGEGWQMFFNVPSLIIVVGGTAAALMVNYSFKDLGQFPQIVKQFLSFQPPDMREYMEHFISLSRLARREGLLALDRSLAEVTDPFMQFGLEMAVDGIEEAEIDEMMRTRMAEEAKKKQMGSRLFTSAAAYAPAFGMIGTLIGLIQMLQNLEDPSMIGAGMAVALITTFYGALLANLVFLPFAAKMKDQSKEALKVFEIIREGVLSIVRGESPSMVEKKLMLFLPRDGQQGPVADDAPQAIAQAA